MCVCKLTSFSEFLLSESESEDIVSPVPLKVKLNELLSPWSCPIGVCANAFTGVGGSYTNKITSQLYCLNHVFLR